MGVPANVARSAELGMGALGLSTLGQHRGALLLDLGADRRHSAGGRLFGKQGNPLQGSSSDQWYRRRLGDNDRIAKGIASAGC